MTQWFAIASALLGIVTVAGLVAGVIAIVRLQDARDLMIVHLDPAATSALRLSNALINEETGVRGFALSGQDAFLAPYRAGRRDEQHAAAELRELVQGTSAGDVLMDLDDVERLAADWRRTYAVPTILLVRERGPEAVTAAATDAGRARFDRVRAALRRQQADIAAARVDGRQRLDEAARFLSFSFVAIALLLLSAGIAVTIALRRAVGRPVLELGQGVRRVARGEFDHELVGSGPRDIVELAEDVESMRRRIVAELAAVKAAQARVERQARELERSNSELEQFAYVASHDLQEPLRKVASFCQLLEERYRGQLDERADQYIDFAVDGAKRMQQLINDLLAFSRVGRMTGDWELVGLDDVLRQALGNLETAIADSGAQVSAEPLPTVAGEASLLTLVFQNLIGNAIKFRTEVPPQVHVGVARHGDEWVITCADDGIGIEPQYAERVFVIFQRLHAKQEYPGTGIGLAMCRKIVEYHGGQIWLDTDATAGTVFRFTLPVIEETP
ncbi:MAG TPA: ATP-binding protein [Thermoleophilaceae bacterium]